MGKFQSMSAAKKFLVGLGACAALFGAVGAMTGTPEEKSKELIQPTASVKSIGTKVTAKPKPKPIGNCAPDYSGCVPIASDVDCADGDGPAYVSGPVYVTGTDIYHLDRDNDGVACE